MLYKLRFASGLNLPWYGSMEWKMEEILVWNGIWNGRKLPVWNMEKSSSIPFHSMPWQERHSSYFFVSN